MNFYRILTGFCLFTSLNASATVRYVNLNSPSPTPPFTSWATAATTIQAAIDAASAGDEIVVTNGVYATGGRAIHGTMTNRVAVDKPLVLRSVNGPQFTIIQGYQVPVTTNGDGAIRCVYLTNGASLSGFTLTNGATRATNDYSLYRESGGGGVHCEALQSYLDPPIVVSNCVITGNSAFGPGGGAYGGGVDSAEIIDCELRGNTAQVGGGVAEGWVQRCVIADNTAASGGGASEAFSNEAGGFEYYSCKLDNCLLVGNRAQFNGGGAYSCELNNCTVIGNYAGQAGGGVYGFIVIQVQHPSRAVNSVVYSNTAPSDENFISYACNFENSCTTPLPTWGSGNITNQPSFVDFAGGNFRLQSHSPCINTGTNYYAPGPLDLDGNPRIRDGTVDMGAFEFQQGSTGIVHYVNLLSPNSVSPYISWATAATNIQDAIDVASSGEEIIVTNGVYATGGRAVHGTMTNRVAVNKPVALRSVNGPQFTILQGYQVPGTTNGDGAIRCVYLTNGARLSGFTLTNGATLVGESYPPLEEVGGGGVFCESTNAVLSDCLIIGNSALAGGGAYSGTLQRCELRNNTAFGVCCGVVGGGGAVLAILNNCKIIGNLSVAGGGGTLFATLNNCLILSNSLHGAYGGVLNNCTVVGNSGTGAYGYYGNSSGIRCALNNCVLYYNQPENWNSWNGLFSYAMSNCCTIPELIPPNPIFPPLSGNITNAPMFLDLVAGNFHLQANSPCINAGINPYAPGAFDLDGSPRLVGSAVDMGAYEFQSTQPTLKIMQSGMNIVLLWPLWASDFGLQQTLVFPPGPSDWSIVSASPVVLNGESTVTLPIASDPRLFRLFKP